MRQLAKVNRIVRKAVSAVLKGPAGFERVFSEPTAESDGQEALNVMIVLKPALLTAGEDQFPILWYATQAEFEESDEAES